MNEYLQQAQDFLAKTNATMQADHAQRFHD